MAGLVISGDFLRVSRDTQVLNELRETDERLVELYNEGKAEEVAELYLPGRTLGHKFNNFYVF